MNDELVMLAVEDGDDEEIGAILREVCELTGMGFAAVARVTEHRWIACQVLDGIGFGLTPSGELEVQKTICNDIRQHAQAVVFDDAVDDPAWETHPVPIFTASGATPPFRSSLPMEASTAPCARSIRLLERSRRKPWSQRFVIAPVASPGCSARNMRNALHL